MSFVSLSHRRVGLPPRGLPGDPGRGRGGGGPRCVVVVGGGRDGLDRLHHALEIGVVFAAVGGLSQ